MYVACRLDSRLCKSEHVNLPLHLIIMADDLVRNKQAVQMYVNDR